MRPVLSVVPFSSDLTLCAMSLPERQQALGELGSEIQTEAAALSTESEDLANRARLAFAAGEAERAAQQMAEAAAALETIDLGSSQGSIWRDLGIYQLAVGQMEEARTTFTAVKRAAERYGASTGVTSTEYLHLHVHLAAEMFGTKAALGALEDKLLPLLVRKRGSSVSATLAVQLLRSVLLNLTGQYDSARQGALALLTTCRQLYPAGLLSHLVVSTAVAWSEIGLDRFAEAAARLRTALASLTVETAWSPSVISYAEVVLSYAEANTPAGSDIDALEKAASVVAGCYGPRSPVTYNVEEACCEVLVSAGKPEARERFLLLATKTNSPEVGGTQYTHQLYVLEALVSLCGIGGDYVDVMQAVEMARILRELYSDRTGEASVLAIQADITFASVLLSLAAEEEQFDHVREALRVLSQALEKAEGFLGHDHPMTWQAAAAYAQLLLLGTESGGPDLTPGSQIEGLFERYRAGRNPAGDSSGYPEVTKGDLNWQLALADFAAARGETEEADEINRKALSLSEAAFGATGLYTHALRTGLGSP